MDDVIRSTLARQVDAWNRGDIAGFCALCAEDVVYLRGDGPIRGREALERQYQAAYPDRAAMATLTLDVVSTEVRGDAAVAVVRWSVGSRGGHALLVLRRGDDGWRLAYDATLRAP